MKISTGIGLRLSPLLVALSPLSPLKSDAVLLRLVRRRSVLSARVGDGHGDADADDKESIDSCARWRVENPIELNFEGDGEEGNIGDGGVEGIAFAFVFGAGFDFAFELDELDLDLDDREDGENQGKRRGAGSASEPSVEDDQRLRSARSGSSPYSAGVKADSSDSREQRVGEIGTSWGAGTEMAWMGTG